MRHPKLIITFSDGNVIERRLRECGIVEYVSSLVSRDGAACVFVGYGLVQDVSRLIDFTYEKEELFA